MSHKLLCVEIGNGFFVELTAYTSDLGGGCARRFKVRKGEDDGVDFVPQLGRQSEERKIRRGRHGHDGYRYEDYSGWAYMCSSRCYRKSLVCLEWWTDE